MKLFGEPITVDQVEIGKFYRILYKTKSFRGEHNFIDYGKVDRVVRQQSIGSNFAYQYISLVDGRQNISFNDIIKIYPFNIELNKTYLFNIDDIEMVEAMISNLNNDGMAYLTGHRYNSRIHILEITGVLPTGIHNKIMYATAAHAAHNVPNPNPDSAAAAAADATKANRLIYNVYDSLLGSDIDEYAGTGGKTQRSRKRWSTKYKRSINCRNPKGFSQKQYCKYGRRKTQSRTNLK